MKTTPKQIELYNCQYCGTPTQGTVIGMKGKKLIREMCKGCEAYIGSPAAQQEGATMQNRITMKHQYERTRTGSIAPAPAARERGQRL